MIFCPRDIKYVPACLPQGSVVFTTKKPDLLSKRKPNYIGLREKLITPGVNHFVVHPTKVYAWNPGCDLKFGIINFSRPICSPTSVNGVTKLLSGYAPSD